MNIKAMIGTKLFKEFDDDTISIVRIIKCRFPKSSTSNPSEITIRDEASGEISKVRLDSLKGYTPLEPDALITFNIVNVIGSDKEIVKDVVVTASKILNIKIGDTLPYAVCRQCITDIFNNLQRKTMNDDMVGLSINQDTCPSNFNFPVMLACSEIIHNININMYRTDTLKDILDIIKTDKYDEVLEKLYLDHCKAVGDTRLAFKKHHKGWCKDLETLLTQNNFQEDINQMLGITNINPIIKDHIVEKELADGSKYPSLDDELTMWLRSMFKIGIDNTTALEFGHDINLADYNNNRYLLLRDQTNTLYLVMYTLVGEHLAADLIAEAEKKDFSEEFRINFYNKYNNINNK